MEINVELLIGKNVCDVDGTKIGRIEEFKVERDDKSCVLDSYLIGSSALIERLAAWTLVRPIARALTGGPARGCAGRGAGTGRREDLG